MKGKFVTIEGGEGSGKTEQIKLINEHLKSKGCDVLVTREPGGSPIAEDIRSVILDSESSALMHPLTEVLLYAAARLEHLNDVIIPAMNEGKIVISDRYVDSSIVYQGLVKGVGWKKVYDINMEVTNGLLPDLTIYFDVCPKAGLTRIRDNPKREVNRFDLESVRFHDKVREGYQYLASDVFCERFVSVDAGQSIDSVFADTIKFIEDMVL